MRQGLMFEWAWQNPGRCKVLGEWRRKVLERESGVDKENMRGNKKRRKGAGRKKISRKIGVGMRGMGSVSVQHVVETLGQLVQARPFVLMPLAITIVNPAIVDGLDPSLISLMNGNVEIWGGGFGKLSSYDWGRGKAFADGVKGWRKEGLFEGKYCRCVTCRAELKRDDRRGKVTVCGECFELECLTCVAGQNITSEVGMESDNDDEHINEKELQLVKDKGKCGGCGNLRRWADVVRGVRLVDKERMRPEDESDSETNQEDESEYDDSADLMKVKKRKGVSDRCQDNSVGQAEIASLSKLDNESDEELLDLVNITI